MMTDKTGVKGITEKQETGIPGFTIRFAAEKDVGLVLSFIRGIAEYEKMLDQVEATEAILHQSLFVDYQAEAVIGEYQGEPVGFALFYHHFSTFVGRAGLYLEDLFVLPAMRGKGFGKCLLTFLANVAMERGCKRMEWQCLNWNTPSIAFYKSLGARSMDDWKVYRLSGESLAVAAAEYPGRSKASERREESHV